MSDEFGTLSLRSEKDLLSTHVNESADSVNGYLRSQWDIVRDGLWQGMGERNKEAQDNLLTTGTEVAASAGIAGGLVKAFAAGGRWKAAAEVAGVAFGTIMGLDMYRRGSAIHEAYSKTNSDSFGNARRENAIAQHAGAGLFDYSLILASAGLGAAAVLHPYSKSFGKSSLSGTRMTELDTSRVRNSKDGLAEKPQEPLRALKDIDKVVDDLAFALDYQISKTAMEKISEALKESTHEEFNDIVRKLAEKDRKFQGMDLYVGEWNRVAQRWDALKLYYTDETMITHLIVQKGDTLRIIADQETLANPRRTPQDIEDYIAAVIYKNKLGDKTDLNPGQILVLPYAS